MADRYWFGDGGNWSDTAHWGTASNGVGAPAAVPTSVDDVYFDAASFTAADQTVTVDAAASCKDLNFTGVSDTPTIAGSATLNIYGTLVAIAAMTKSYLGTLTFLGTGTVNITLAGTWSCYITFNAAGTWTLQDALNIGAGVLNLNNGTVDTNGQTVTCGSFTIGGTETRTLTLGASVVNCTPWNYSGSNLTLTEGTSTIKVTGTGAFVGGGETYYNVELNGTAHTISGDNVFSTLTLKADTTQTITFTDGTTQTITTPVITGSVGKVKTLVGTSTAGWIVTRVGGGAVTADYLALSYSEGRPQRTWIAGINSTDTILNTGWLFGRDWAEHSGAGWWVIRH